MKNRELALNTALTEARLALEELQQERRHLMSLCDSYMEHMQAMMSEMRKGLDEFRHDRQQMAAMIQRVLSIYERFESFYDKQQRERRKSKERFDDESEVRGMFQ